MMNKTWVVWLALAACGGRDRARVVSFSPRGDVPAGGMVQGIRVMFDRPIVAERQVGRALAASPLRIDPDLEGSARWVDRQTIVFLPKAEPRASTRYRVTPRPASDLAARATPFEETFVYGRLRITDVGFADPGADFQPPLPVVTLRFSQPVRPTRVATSCAFFTDEERRAVKLVDVEVDAPGGTRIARVQPERKLDPGLLHSLTCDAGLRPAAGSEGLAAEHSTPFRTYGSLAVVRTLPDAYGVRADDVEIEVEFSNPVEAAEVDRHVRVTAADRATGAARKLIAKDNHRRVYRWRGSLDAGSLYRIEVDRRIHDVFGQPLGEHVSVPIKVGDAEPELAMDRGLFALERSSPRYPVWTRNVAEYTVTCGRIPEKKLAALLTGPLNYDAWYDAGERGALEFQSFGAKRFTFAVRPTAKKNDWYDGAIDLGERCGGGGTGRPGVYVVDVESAEVNYDSIPRRALANVTDLGVVAKVGDASSLVWVVRLSTGEPVAGAAVRIQNLEGKVHFDAKTGEDGVVLAPGAATLKGVKKRPGPEAEPEEGWEDEGEDWEGGGWYRRARRVIVTASLHDDFAVLDTNWNNGIQIWNFGLPTERGSGEARVRGFLHSDRGLYRPGDTVHLRGLARVVERSGAMRLPRGKGGKRAHVVVENPRGATIVDENVAMTAFGGFSRDLVVDADAPLGDYVVRGTVEGQTFSETFAVEEYRPRTFELKARPGARHVFRKASTSFSVGAQYLWGGPLRGARLAWGLRRRRALPAFPGYAQYTFLDLATRYDRGDYWARDEERSFSEFVADGEVDLDDKGGARVKLPREDASPDGPIDYLLEATVTDSTGQAVTVGEIVTRHPSEFYVGLHPAEYVQATEMPFAVQAVAVAPDGARRAVRARLTLVRRSYDCRYDDGYRCEVKTAAPSVDREVNIPETGALVERVVLHEPGPYVVTIHAEDGKGGVAVASDTLYLVGKGEAFWSGDEGDRITLVASRASYQPGDVARIVPQANLPGALALVTLERDGIVSHRIQRLAGSAEAIELPIEADWAPNVFAGVTLVRGRTGDGDAGRPRFKMGMLRLAVDAAPKRLAVRIETDRPSYEPGQTVTATVSVHGADGQPVRAEVALAAADEGVLQIAGYRTPDPVATFYAPWRLAVESSTTWNRIAQIRDPEKILEDQEMGGDGGGDEAGRVRSRFVGTAYWNPALVTAADGSARVTFAAPDNLTAFRLMAVAADAGDRFGSSEKRFTVAKDLLAMPALPRFLTAGDEARVGVVVHNNTSDKLAVDVEAAFRGVELKSDAKKTVTVAGGASKPVPFAIRVRPDARGDAVFRFTARGGARSDAVEVTLPVHRPTTTDVVVVGEGSTSSHAEHALALPADALPDGSLEVVLDPAGLSRLQESLKYLVGYPYGCLEQTTSRVVPMVALRELSGAIEVAGVNRGELDGYVRTGIAKILRHQHDDGGFGLWPGAHAEPHYTAYALWGLHLARQASYAVDIEAMRRGVRYLSSHLASDGVSSGYPFASKAFSLHVLAALRATGDSTLSAATALSVFQTRFDMPFYGKAFLTRALKLLGQDAQAGTLLGELLAGLPASGAIVLNEAEGSYDDYYFSSAVRSTAIALSALLEVAPDHAMVPRFIEGLLSRRTAGRWDNTQENVYSMVALAEFAKRRGGQGAPTVRVRVGDREVLSKRIAPGDIERVRVPASRLKGAGKLVIESDREVFYSATLRLVRPLGPAARPAGFAVRREYLDAETGAPLGEIKLGQLVRVVLHVEADAARAHVALVDALPAGLEPVLDRFVSLEPPPRPAGWWAAPVTTWEYRETHDDRVEMFADALSAGASTQEYLVRATTPGTFVAAPPMAEAMYSPGVYGRGEGGTVTVSR